jgi:hypothetical protein
MMMMTMKVVYWWFDDDEVPMVVVWWNQEEEGGRGGREGRWCEWKASCRYNPCEKYDHMPESVVTFLLLRIPQGILSIEYP